MAPVQYKIEIVLKRISQVIKVTEFLNRNFLRPDGGQGDLYRLVLKEFSSIDIKIRNGSLFPMNNVRLPWQTFENLRRQARCCSFYEYSFLIVQNQVGGIHD
jgi:hypothetical protein